MFNKLYTSNVGGDFNEFGIAVAYARQYFESKKNSNSGLRYTVPDQLQSDPFCKQLRLFVRSTNFCDKYVFDRYQIRTAKSIAYIQDKISEYAPQCLDSSAGDDDADNDGADHDNGADNDAADNDKQQIDSFLQMDSDDDDFDHDTEDDDFDVGGDDQEMPDVDGLVVKSESDNIFDQHMREMSEQLVPIVDQFEEQKQESNLDLHLEPDPLAHTFNAQSFVQTRKYETFYKESEKRLRRVYSMDCGFCNAKNFWKWFLKKFPNLTPNQQASGIFKQFIISKVYEPTNEAAINEYVISIKCILLNLII